MEISAHGLHAPRIAVCKSSETYRHITTRELLYEKMIFYMYILANRAKAKQINMYLEL